MENVAVGNHQGQSNMPKRLFTPDELHDLTIPLSDRIKRQLVKKNHEKAIALSKEMKESRIVLHDFFADSCTVLWSWVGERLGEDSMEEMFRYVFEHSARRQLFSIGILFRIYQRFAASLLAESGWRAHSCFGAGEFPAKFTITEDDEKFSFHMDPCASGARLWLKGIYEEGRGGRLSKDAHWWTWNRKDFPYYCMHCPFLNEALPYETMGHLLWPVDEIKSPDDVCTWHIYKDPNLIPYRYYRRLGLTKRLMAPMKVKRWKKRFFTDEELHEMARPIPDRLIEKIQRGDLKGAKKLCTMVKDEFLFLHDLYINLLIATLTFISEKAGEDALGEAFHSQYENCVKDQIVATMKSLSPKEKIRFLAVKIFGTDNCNGTGLPRGKFSITETDHSITFTLNPCGSGGRLLRGGAYKPMTFLKKTREAVEDFFLVTFAKIFPLPDAFLDWMFLVTGGYVCQRKPYAQGETKKHYPWSFGRKKVPYYCCQCGTLQEKLGETYVKIHPPEGRNDPCIWEFNKLCMGNRE